MVGDLWQALKGNSYRIEKTFPNHLDDNCLYILYIVFTKPYLQGIEVKQDFPEFFGCGKIYKGE